MTVQKIDHKAGHKAECKAVHRIDRMVGQNFDRRAVAAVGVTRTVEEIEVVE